VNKKEEGQRRGTKGQKREEMNKRTEERARREKRGENGGVASINQHHIFNVLFSSWD
jgi:hypothetical protein